MLKLTFYLVEAFVMILISCLEWILKKTAGAETPYSLRQLTMPSCKQIYFRPIELSQTHHVDGFVI